MLTIIWTFIIFFSVSCNAWALEKILIREGVIDLRAHVFDNDFIIEASGQVPFYWKKTYAEALQQGQPARLLNVPGPWNQDSQYSALGYGVYRLTVQVPPDVPIVAIKMPRLNFAHRIWSRDRLLGEVGNLHPDPERNKPGFAPPRIYILQAIDGQTDFWLEASEYGQHFPGLNGRVLVGHPMAVAYQEQRDWFLAMIPQGGMLLIGLYMIGVGWLYRQERSLIGFGMSAVCLSVYLLAADEARGVSMLGVTSHRLYYAIYNVWFFLPYMMFIYFNGQFPDQRRPRTQRFWIIVSSVFYALQFVVPLYYFFFLINVFQVLVLSFMGQFFLLAYRVWRAKSPGGRALFMGVMATGLSVINDLLYHMELIRSINMIAFGCVVFFLWLAIALSTRALNNLSRAEKAEAEAVSLANHLEERVQEQTRDLRELNRFISEQVLRRYLPPELLEDIQQNKLQFDDHPRSMAITVLFADLCEFTKTTELLGAERVTALLNEFFNEMTRIVFNTGGTIDKFTGDGLMVLFGAPRAAPSSELNQRAVRCAIDMQMKMRELNQRWQLEYGQGLELRIGLNHGAAVVGSFGNDQRVDYTAIGGTVNLASRLEGIAQPGQITCSEGVLKDLGPDIAYSIGSRQLKGFKEPIAVYAINLHKAAGAA